MSPRLAPRYNRGMAASPCEKCGKPRSEQAAVCPHCGARRGGSGELSKQELSAAEVQAVAYMMSLGHPPPSRGVMEAMVLPHPGTSGAARAVELGLTVLCAPLIAAGTLAVAIRNRRTVRTVLNGEATPVLAMVLFGSVPLDLVLSLLEASGMTRLVVGAGSIAGVCVRAVIRARASRSPLHRLDE